MCGIIGYTGKNLCQNILVNSLKTLEYRGYDSAGIAYQQENSISIIKAGGRISALEEKLASSPARANCGIGHTRWATHGAPTDINAHPHGNEKIAVVHNGIIENYLEIKDFLSSHGVSFLSQTDSEVISALLLFHYNGDPIDAIEKTVAMLKGSFAVAAIFSCSKNTIYAFRKDSPLIIGIGNGENFITSDISAILPFTKKYFILQESELAIVTNEKVSVFLDGAPVEKIFEEASWEENAAKMDGFPHFMLKEIHEQPKVLRDTINAHLKDGLPAFPAQSFKNISRITIVACGTAMHAGLIGKNIIEQLARVSVNTEVASEFRYKNPIISENELVILVSQSGETADTLAALRLAKSRGAHTLAVVNVPHSTIAREADSIINTLAGPEIAVASTKAYSSQVAAMYLLAIAIAKVKNVITEDAAKSLCADLLASADDVASLLKCDNVYKEVARKIAPADSVFFIGRGLDYVTALEGSLKLKEISYIHCEAYPAGELKHGTISLISDGVPVVAICTQQNVCDKLQSNVKEVAARGADVIFVTSLADNIDAADNAFVVPVPSSPDFFAALTTIVPLQMISYFTAIERGCDVDKPRNLAKSVTVE